jgi:hypothetical protein
VVLAALKPLERRFAKRKTLPQVRVTFAGRASLAAVEQVLTVRDLPASTIVTRRIPDDGDEVTVEFARGFDRRALGPLADALRGVAGVESVSLDITSRAS